jgi:hypothetical protein
MIPPIGSLQFVEKSAKLAERARLSRAVGKLPKNFNLNNA